MRVDFAVLERQYLKYQSEYEENALRVLRSGWYILGKELVEFERAYADFHKVKYCIGVNSGLDALRLALAALEIGPGDEVIVQANTFIATALAITENGADPVFVESDPFFGIDVNSIESAITPKTKAIIPVHLFGQPCDMTPIKNIAKKYHLYIIEDCAQAHGALYNNELVGTIGDIGCFSFYPMKPIGAFGDAGAVITNNDMLAEKVRMLRNYGSKTKYKHEIIGINSRLDEIQAAILMINLKYVSLGNSERQAIAKRYLSEITNPLITLPQTRDNGNHVYHIFALKCQYRDALYQFLLDNEIHTQIHYPIPCHLAECYKHLGKKVGDYPLAEKCANEELSLPIYVGMPENEITYVIEILNKFHQ
jgi:dTDP-4-amino-4,6-dideoxygalactose transaminase